MTIMNISFPEINELLDQSISVESQTEVDDGAGGETTSWITESIVDGKVSPLNGKEIYEMQNINPDINSKIFLKKGSVITEQNRTSLLSTVELITNGDMELDSDWANYNGVLLNEQSTAEVYENTYSRHFQVDGTNQGVQSDSYTTENNKEYTLGFWVRSTETSVRVVIRKGDNSGWISDTTFSVTPDVWEFKVIRYIEAAEGSGAYIAIHSSSNTSGDWYIDDVSVKEVTKHYDVLFVKNPVSANEFLIAYTKRRK